MCGRFTLALPNTPLLRERFALGAEIDVVRRFNVAPGDDVLAVTQRTGANARAEMLRWGLVPHWASSPSLGAKTINARAETATQRPAYRDSFARRRCLIIADGFYEWERRDAAPKQPWWISRKDGQPFAFAGLWASWRREGHDRSLHSCAIVTTQAAAAISDIHARMPVILQRPHERSWLAGDTPARDLHEMLMPLPDDQIARRPVSTAVNDARYDGPECLADPVPNTLF